MKTIAIQSGRYKSGTLIEMCNALIPPKVTYGLHLVPLNPDLSQAWTAIENLKMIIMLDCYSKKTKSRLRTISRQLTLVQRRGLQILSLKSSFIAQ